jgi:hypothetical protein
MHLAADCLAPGLVQQGATVAAGGMWEGPPRQALAQVLRHSVQRGTHTGPSHSGGRSHVVVLVVWLWK